MNMRAKVLSGMLVVAVVAAIPLFLQWREITELHSEFAKLTGKASAVANKSSQFHSGNKATNQASLKSILSEHNEVDRLRNLLDFASTLDAAGARALLEDLAKQPVNNENRTAINVLIDR